MVMAENKFYDIVRSRTSNGHYMCLIYGEGGGGWICRDKNLSPKNLFIVEVNYIKIYQLFHIFLRHIQSTVG